MLLRITPFIIFICTLSLYSCSGQENIRQGWSNEALQMPTGISPSALPDPGSDSARMIAHYCSQCHGIPSPESNSASDWVQVFRRMVLRMERSNYMGMGMQGNMMMGGMMSRGMMGAEVPTEEEQKIMLTYLQDHALTPISPEAVPGATSAAASLFAQTCSRCHALPSPQMHTASQWPAVVDRMRQHMKDFHLNVISAENAGIITEYLQKNATKE
jgi:cytochrome c5